MDRRTKIQKLQAMAAQSASPQESEIARRKLLELGVEPQPDSDWLRQFRLESAKVTFESFNFRFGGGTVYVGDHPIGTTGNTSVRINVTLNSEV